MTRNFKYWFRWLSVLPGALLAVILASFPLHYVLYATLISFIDPYPEFPERFLLPFVVGVAFVWVGYYIAPERKFETAVVLFGLYMFIQGGFIFLAIAGVDWMGRNLFLEDSGLRSIMGIAGASTGLIIARKYTHIHR